MAFRSPLLAHKMKIIMSYQNLFMLVIENELSESADNNLIIYMSWYKAF